MSKKLPEFEGSTTLQPVAAPHISSSWENTFDKLGNRVDRQITNILDFQASQEGKNAGGKLDFKPKTPITRQDVIFQRRALAANQVAINNSVRGEARSQFNHEISPGNFSLNSPHNFRKNMTSYMDGILQTIPKENEEYARNLSERVISQHESLLQNRAAKLGNQQARAGLDNSLDTLQQAAFEHASEGGFLDTLDSLAEYGQGIRQINNAVSSGVITPEMGYTQERNWKDQLQAQFYNGQMRQRLNDGGIEAGKEYLNKFIKEPPSDMHGAQFKQTYSAMSGLLNIYEQANKMDTQLIEAQTRQVFSELAQGNLDPDSGQVATLYNNIAQTKGDDAAEKFNQTANNKAAYATMASSLKFVPTEKMNRIANSLGKNFDPDTEQGKAVIGTIQDMLAAHYKNMQEFAKDPKGYTDASPFVQAAYSRENINPDDDGYGILQDGVIQLSKGLAASFAQQRALGAQYHAANGMIRIHALSKEEAQEKAQELNDMPAEMQAQKLSEMANQYGDNANIAFNDLKDAGLTTASLLLPQIAKYSPQNLRYATAAMMKKPSELTSQLKSDEKTEIDNAVIDGLIPLNASLAKYQRFYGSSLTDIQDVTRKIGYEAFIDSGRSLSPSEAAQVGVDAVASSAYNFFGMQGSTIRVPKQYDPNVIKKMAQIKKSQLENGEFELFSLERDFSDTAIKRNYMQDIKDKGVWQTSADDRSLILLDGNGGAVVVKDKKTGQPKTFSISFSSSDNPDSQLVKKATQQALGEGVIYGVLKQEQALLNPVASLKSVKELFGIQ